MSTRAKITKTRAQLPDGVAQTGRIRNVNNECIFPGKQTQERSDSDFPCCAEQLYQAALLPWEQLRGGKEGGGGGEGVRASRCQGSCGCYEAPWRCC